MKKSRSLSIIMAMALAAQGGGAPAVHAMKGQIQDHFLQTVFFRPDLMKTLKPFLSKNIDKIPKIYCTSEFLNCLKQNGFEISDQTENSEEEEEKECLKRIREIISKDDLESLQEALGLNIEMEVIDDFFDNTDVKIPILHYCVMKNAMKCFKFLILNGADPLKEVRIFVNPYIGWDCMSIAVCFGEWEMMRILEERGMHKLNTLGVWEAAALTHRNNLLKLFISKKDEINNFEECINVAMRGAAKGNNLKGLKILIKGGADINAGVIMLTPLFQAAYANSLQAVKVLMSKGADINVKGNGGWTPLHYAVGYEIEEALELLISQGADINAKDNNGETPLHIAARVGCEKVAELLISEGADINTEDKYGCTLLHCIEYGSCKNVVACK